MRKERRKKIDSFVDVDWLIVDFTSLMSEPRGWRPVASERLLRACNHQATAVMPSSGRLEPGQQNGTEIECPAERSGAPAGWRTDERPPQGPVEVRAQHPLPFEGVSGFLPSCRKQKQKHKQHERKIIKRILLENQQQNNSGQYKNNDDTDYPSSNSILINQHNNYSKTTTSTSIITSLLFLLLIIFDLITIIHHSAEATSSEVSGSILHQAHLNRGQPGRHKRSAHQQANGGGNFQQPLPLPDFTEPIGNHTVPVGRDVQLWCKTKDLANFRTAWLRVEDKGILSIHDSLITRNYRIGLINNGPVSALTIKNVQPSDKVSSKFVTDALTNWLVNRISTLYI